MSDANKIACDAYNSIRGNDPEFDSLPMEMKHKLIDLAEKYAAGRSESVGDYAPPGFAVKVRELASTFQTQFAADLMADVDKQNLAADGSPANAPAVMNFDLESDGLAGSDHVDNESVALSAPDVEQKGPLPDDFPYRSALETAEINTYHQLRKRLASNEHIPGIGPAGEAKIAERLANPE